MFYIELYLINTLLRIYVYIYRISIEVYSIRVLRYHKLLIYINKFNNHAYQKERKGKKLKRILEENPRRE